MGFNSQQQEAIDASYKTNVLISAGAGSGKTKILSTKVYKLVHEDHIDPSSLLVLTFTNKSAFDMKEKILEQFDKNDRGSLDSDKILSSHIQTFDSFSLYLVKKYSTYLGIPDNINIMDESILETKKNEILDDIFDEYYIKNDKRFFNTLKKFNICDDKKTKNVVLDIDKKFQSLLPSAVKDFTENYDSKYLSEDFLNKAYSDYLESYYQIIKERLSFILFAYGKDITDPAAIYKDLDKIDLNTYYLHGDFEEETLEKVLNEIRDLLKVPKDKFISSIKETIEEDLFNRRKPKKFEDPKDKEVYKALVGVLVDDFKSIEYGKVNPKNDLTKADDFETQKRILLSFKDDIKLLFTIVNELDKRLMEYKKSVGGFAFSDISRMALSLLTNDDFKVAGDEIKNRYKFILVDEYQDTNDFQELFLNSISEKATLFCVGDAKQSIYGFRNSNCQLFINRKEKYWADNNPDKEKVIEMNTNYRSFKKVLDDINLIFLNYMTSSHGGISYDEKERLHYDSKVNLYSPDKLSPTGEYGINLITIKGMDSSSKSEGEEECQAIINDIITKIRNHYQVLDKEKHILRDCTFSDFAILIRKKRNFTPYEEAFNKAGIPLNNDIESHLSDIDAISLLQSLIALLSFEMKLTDENVRHLFMSVARSYIYGSLEGYDDTKIYKILSDTSNSLLYHDPIMVKINAFIKENQGNSFSTIFLNLLDSFGVIKKLNRVGDIENNVAKIDSFYNLILSQEQVGDGLKEFVTLFKSINKYKVDMTSKTVLDIENAVELTTIHKSKGLEYPIVYLPTTDNCLSKAGNKDKPDYEFSKELGILLPNYQLGESIHTFLNQLNKNTSASSNEEINENVRLFYVALTRAKESIYIVGNAKPKEGLIDMVEHSYHYKKLDKEYYSSYIPALEENDFYKSYQKCLSLQKTSFENLTEIDDPEKKDWFDINVNQKIEADIDSDLDQLSYLLFKKQLEKLDGTEEEIYQVFLHHYFGTEKISTKTLLEGKQYQDKLNSLHIDANETSLENYLSRFSAALINIDETFFLSPSDIKNLDDPKIKIANMFVADLAYVIDRKQDELITTIYQFNTKVFSTDTKIEPLNQQDNKKYKFNIDDSDITYQVNEKKRASKFSISNDSLTVRKKDTGLLYHRLLELTDFKTKDTSFIKDLNERKNIDKVLALPIFADLASAKVYHEYGYYDQELKTTGFIDCLIVRKDHIDIIDYKLKNLTDEAYQEQLATYSRNISALYPSLPVHCYLLSILDGTLQEIQK